MTQQQGRIIKVNKDEFQLQVSDSMTASVIRALTGSTPQDTEVDALPLPDNPFWLRLCVRLLKWYRRAISPSLGQRCVYELSCSRYAELSLRKYGFFKGGYLTIKRLRRCRPGFGGTDNP